MTALAQLPLVAPAPVRVIDLDRSDANALLTEWGHYLGPCNRPFGQMAHALMLDDAPVSVTVAASIVSATVADYTRQGVVELARLCTNPDHPWATRVMLRLWREALAPRWPYWEPVALVAYSQNQRHDGRIYRFDGWRQVTRNAGSSGGGTWSTPRSPGSVAHGRKTLWLYERDVAA